MEKITWCKKHNCEKEYKKDLVKGKTRTYYQCKFCIKEYAKEYRKKNLAKFKKNAKEYRETNKNELKEKAKENYIANKDKIRKDQKEYYKENKEKIIAKTAEYVQNNKEKVIGARKIYRKNNKDKIKAAEKKWKILNIEKIRDYKNKWEKNKLATDPSFKIKKLLSVSIRNALKSRGMSKERRSLVKFLPCSIEEFFIHFEIQFSHPDNLTPDGEIWMTWDNWRIYDKDTWVDDDYSTHTWNIDHIIPHSTFKYVSMEDDLFKKCWSLDNLRPYSAKQNIIDGATRIRHKK